MKITEITAEAFDDLAYPEPQASIYQSSCWSDYLVNKKNTPLFIKYTDDNDLCMALAMFILKKDGLLSNKTIAYCPSGYLINFYDDEMLRNFENELSLFLSRYHVNKIIIEPRIVYDSSKLANDALITMLNSFGYTKTRDISSYCLNLKKYKNYKARVGIILKGKNVDDDYSLFADLINNKNDEEYFNIYNSVKKYASLYIIHLDSIKTKRNLLAEIDDCTKFINDNREDYKYIEDIRNKLSQIDEAKSMLNYIDSLEKTYGSDPVLAGACIVNYSGSDHLMFIINRDKMFNADKIIFNTIVENEKEKSITTIDSFTPFSTSEKLELLGEFTRNI